MQPEAAPFAGAFAAGLLSPDIAAPAFLGDSAGRPVGKRYDVYRNNVTIGLAKSVESIFPAVGHYVGAETFRGVAIDFIRAEPPSSPLLFDYGRGFPDWLDRIAPPEFSGWLSDVARLERIWLDAWHAADATPVQASALAAVEPEKLAMAHLIPHPAARLFRSRHAAASLLRAGRGQGAEPLDRDKPEDALVTRPALDVALRYLPPGAAIFLENLFANRPLAVAAEAAFAEAPEFDIAAAIAATFEAGAFGGVYFE